MRRSAYSVWLFYNAFGYLVGMTTFTLSAVYFVRDVGMNPLQLVLVGTVMELTVFVFEVPTGVVADMVSRRLSVIIGNVLQGAGMILVALVPEFSVILVGYVIWGLGATFESGALEAWITDEMGGRELERVFLRGDQIGYVGSFVGIGLAVALGSVELALPIGVGGALTILLAGVLVLVMPETGFAAGKTDEPMSWRAFRGTAATGARLIRRRPVLLTIVGIAFFFGMWSESIDRLWQAHMLENFDFPGNGALGPVVWFGIITAAGLLISVGVSEVAARRLPTDRPPATVRTLLVLDTVLLAGALVFALAGHFAVAVAAYLVIGIARRLDRPLSAAWLNQNVESRSRATVLSMVNQSDAVGQWGGGPAIGALGTAFSLRAALAGGAFVLTPAIALYAHALRRGGTEPALKEPEAEGAGR